MFRLFTEKKGRQTFELFNDLLSVLTIAGFTIDYAGNPKYNYVTNSELPNGHPRKEDFRIFCKKNNKEYIFYISLYSSGEEPSYLDGYSFQTDGIDTKGCGTIGCIIAINYDINQRAFSQNSNRNITTDIFSAAINKNNNTDYSIYLSTDRNTIFIETTVEGYSSYLIIGDMYGLNSKQGQYIAGSMYTNSGTPAAYSLYTGTLNSASGGTGRSSNIFNGRSNDCKMNALILPEGITYSTLYNGYPAVQQTLTTEFKTDIMFPIDNTYINSYLNKSEYGLNLLKEINIYHIQSSTNYIHLFKTPFFYCDVSSFEHKQEKTINNKRYKFFKFNDNSNDNYVNNLNNGQAFSIRILN